MPAELDTFTRFCRDVLTTENGKPLVVEEFQERILAGYFDGVRETVVIVGKKNGKSSLLAALALHHLLVEPFADVIVVAASRDQAGILLRQVVGYVSRSEALRGRLRVVQREVRYEASGGRIRVLASDSDTVDGQLPTLALVDELGRHKSEELYGVLRDGLGPRKGRLIAISTAGDDEESPLGKLRTAALKMPGLERIGAYKHVRAPGFTFHEWSLDPAADVFDLALLKSANPASWIDDDELRARRDSPSTQPWQLKRFTAGIWTAGEDSAISETEWAACANPGCEIPEGADNVEIGVDLGWRWDTTAIVPVWESPGGLVRIHRPAVLVPPQDGTSLDAEDVFAACELFDERWPGCGWVLDPEAGGEQLAQRLDRDLSGPVATHSQKSGPMCRASALLAETISAGGLEHPNDETLNRHVLAAAARWVGPAWRFDKPRRKALPIDATIALAMGLRVLKSASNPAGPPPGARMPARSPAFL